ncbi:T9SS type A sorting domain-containing protein [Fibrella aquatilis]|uniref:T9SS type A sorting domain-containing protein n=1 Tax=Fibrella aquatilis TaxID=2817059 RepID=A0A939K0S0_9BACT|nr:T9SS type A sorting domain-containing protein [Fibrella aquatilis]MBO0932306.1 T9SS type A sorting domain-containing protein [Fibrella aquatilis]
MNLIITYRTLVVMACLSVATLASSFAQTIGAPTVSPANPCPGSPISATVATTGSFSAGNVFTLQLSDEFGTFTAPLAVTTVTASPASATAIIFTATLPASLNYGTAYRFRVRSSAPVITGSQSGAAITIGTPLPGLAATASFCQSTGNQNISATGSTVEWYTGFNAAAPVVFSGNTYSVPTTNAGTITYYATQTVGGCKSAKAAINVTVNAPPSAQPTVGNTSPAYCPTASPTPLSASTNGTGASIRWYSPPSSATTGGTTLAAPQTTGTYAYTVSQLSAQGCESPKQFVNVTVYTAPTTVPTIANTSPTYCANNAPANLSASINGAGSTIRWTDPSNAVTNSFTITTPTASGVYQVQQLSANGCPGPQQPVTVTVNPVPVAPTLTTNPLTYCTSNVPANLSANTVGSGNSLKWYSPANAGGGTLVQSTIPAPTTAGTYSFSVSQVSGAGCEGPQVVLTVTVNAAPTTVPTIANTSPTYCANNAPTSLSAGINGTGASIRWTAPGGAVTNASTISAPTASGVYQVQQISANGCPGPQQAVTVTVNPVPVAPTLTAATQTYCNNAAPAALSANTVGGGNSLKWYSPTNAGGGTLVQPTIPAPTTAGTYSYSVSQVSGAGCEGPQVVLTVTVNAAPTTTPTIATTNPTYCANALPANLAAAINGTGASIRWTSPTGVVTNSLSIAAPTTSGIYQVQQVSANGCLGPQQAVTVTVNAVPAVPGVSNVTFCQNRSTQVLTATGTNLTWYDAASNVLPGAPSPAISATGTTNYFVTQTNSNSCVSSKATLAVTVNAVPVKPTPITPREYCAGETAVALSATGSNLLWYGINDTGGVGSGQATVPTTATAGVTNYYVTQTVASCESDRQVVPVTVKRKPGQPTAVSNLEFCQNYAAPVPTATAETGASLSWVAGGTTSPTPPAIPTNSVQTYSYAVYQTLNGCSSDQAAFTVRVKPTPAAPGITPFQLCQFGPTRALQVNGQQVNYYDGNSSKLAGAPTLPVDQPQTLSYKVTQSLDGCESPKTDYVVIVYPKPGAPITQSVQYCLDTQDQPKQNVQPLSAQVSGNNQNLRWFFVDGAEFPAAPTPVTSSTSVFDFQVSQTVNNCQSDRATLRASVLTTPTPVLSSSVVAYCRNDVAKPFEATGENLTWIDPNNVLTTTTPTPPTINAVSGATYQVYARGTANGCYSARAKVKLVVNTSPTLSLLGSSTINYGLSTSLQLKFTSTPPYAYTLSDGTSGTAVDSLVTVSVKPLRTTTYQVANVTNNCGSGLPGNPATATVTVNIPTITTAPLAVTGGLCVGNNFSVAYTTAGTFNTGNTFRVQIADTTSKNYVDVSLASQANPLTAALPANLKGGPYFVRVTASNPGAEVAGANSPTVLMVKALPTATLLGTQNIYETYPATLTVVLTGDAPWAITYSQDGGSPISFNTAASTHLLSVQPAKTATYTLGTVTNNCGTGPVSGTAVVTVLPLLAVEEPLNDAVSIYPTPTQAMLTVDINARLTAENPATITLTDLIGRPALTRRVTDNRTQLDLSQQPAGLYLLNVAVGDKRVVRKVMKQ